mmetsp:Transcript_13448/g.20434  ORF Transcript_13448/g.20434 Transcript_13448/m.20434 type:complete len:207 (-) Transcript_13448:169-789(-)
MAGLGRRHILSTGSVVFAALIVRPLANGDGHINLLRSEGPALQRFRTSTPSFPRLSSCETQSPSQPQSMTVKAALDQLEETLKKDNFWGDLSRPIAAARQAFSAKDPQAVSRAVELLEELLKQFQALKVGGLFEKEASALSAVLQTAKATIAKGGNVLESIVPGLTTTRSSGHEAALKDSEAHGKQQESMQKLGMWAFLNRFRPQS